MKFNIPILLLNFCFCAAGVSAAAAPAVSVAGTDTVQVYFREGDASLELSLCDNGKSLDGLLGLMASDTSKYVIAISLEGNSSPTGTEAFNREISRRRTESVIEYLRSRTAVPDSLIGVKADGVDWDGLAAMVERDGISVGGATENRILKILRETPVFVRDSSGRIVDGRKKQLMELEGGRVYRLLEQRYYDLLRKVCIHIRYREVPSLDRIDAVALSVPTPLTHDVLGAYGAVTAGARSETPLHRMAIKTNLLYDAVLMPSVEAEYRVGSRWSVNLEGDVAWWKNEGRHKYYQIATVSPECRYWFRTKSPWHGHYVGAFTGFSWYDLENGALGYKGESGMAGLSYGYMFPISRALSFELGVGFGYLFCENEEYLPIDGHYVYQQTSRLHYFGPLKLKFAIVWRLWDAARKK